MFLFDQINEAESESESWIIQILSEINYLTIWPLALKNGGHLEKAKRW